MLALFFESMQPCTFWVCGPIIANRVGLSFGLLLLPFITQLKMINKPNAQAWYLSTRH